MEQFVEVLLNDGKCREDLSTNDQQQNYNQDNSFYNQSINEQFNQPEIIEVDKQNLQDDDEDSVQYIQDITEISKISRDSQMTELTNCKKPVNNSQSCSDIEHNDNNNKSISESDNEQHSLEITLVKTKYYGSDNINELSDYETDEEDYSEDEIIQENVIIPEKNQEDSIQEDNIKGKRKNKKKSTNNKTENKIKNKTDKKIKKLSKNQMKDIIKQLGPSHSLVKMKSKPISNKKPKQSNKKPADSVTIEKVKKKPLTDNEIRKDIVENIGVIQNEPLKRIKYTKLVGYKRGPKLKNIPSKTFPCKFCTYYSTSNWNLMRHVNIVHHLKKDIFNKNLENVDVTEIFEGEGDSNEFNEELIDLNEIPATKMQHEEALNGNKRGPKSQVPESSKVYNCFFCTYSSSRGFDLKRHIATIHKKEKKYKCKLCDFKTAYTLSLKQHVKKMHDENKYVCSDCKFNTAKRTEYNKHLKEEHNIGTYKCNICWEFTGFSPVQVTHHKKAVHFYIYDDTDTDIETSSDDLGSEPEFGYPDGVISGTNIEDRFMLYK